MPDWKVISEGVWSLQLRPGLLSLYVARGAKSGVKQAAFWPQINGVVSRRGYPSLEQAQQMAVAGAKKLLAEIVTQLEELK